MHEVQFAVEHAGCMSCAARIRGALEELGTVESVEVDEAADLSVVRLISESRLSQDAVDRMLGNASQGSDHEYRRQSGSWLVRLAKRL